MSSSDTVSQQYKECEICYENIKTHLFNTLPCQHKLCHSCFSKITKCPFCRQPYGDVSQNEPDTHIEYIDIEIDHIFVEYTSPRQRRRQRRNERRRNETRHSHPTRQIHITPLQVFQLNEFDIITITPQNNTQRKIKNKHDKSSKKSKNNKNEKKRIHTSNTWNAIRNQQNIY